MPNPFLPPQQQGSSPLLPTKKKPGTMGMAMGFPAGRSPGEGPLPPTAKAPDPFQEESDTEVTGSTKSMIAEKLPDAIEEAINGPVSLDGSSRDQLQQLKSESESVTGDTGKDDPLAIDAGMDTLSPGPGMKGNATPLLDRITKFYEKNYDISTDAGAGMFSEYMDDTEAFISDIATILSFGPSLDNAGIKDKLHAARELVPKDGNNMEGPPQDERSAMNDKVAGELGSMDKLSQNMPMGRMPLSGPPGGEMPGAGGIPPMAKESGRPTPSRMGPRPPGDSAPAMDRLRKKRAMPMRKPMI